MTRQFIPVETVYGTRGVFGRHSSGCIHALHLTGPIQNATVGGDQHVAAHGGSDDDTVGRVGVEIGGSLARMPISPSTGISIKPCFNCSSRHRLTSSGY